MLIRIKVIFRTADDCEAEVNSRRGKFNISMKSSSGAEERSLPLTHSLNTHNHLFILNHPDVILKFQPVIQNHRTG